jgi:hypothetical protein
MSSREATPLLDTHKQSGAQENAVLTREALDRLEHHEDRIARYSRGHARALDQAGWLRDAEPTSELQSEAMLRTAAKLETCASWLEFRAYFTEDTIKLTAARLCEQYKLCPLCAARRAGRGVRRYAARVQHVMSEAPTLRPYLVTLTMRNQDDLDTVFARFMDCKRRLLQRRRDSVKVPPRAHSVTMHWDGFVGSLEIKRGKNSDAWHPHVHLVVLSREDIANEDRVHELSAEWHAVTGDSFIVDARSFQHPEDPARDLVEVLKYPMKFQGLSLADAWHAHEVTRGRRFLFSGGSLWGVKVELLDETLSDDLPFIELAYQYTLGGYAQVDPDTVTPSRPGADLGSRKSTRIESARSLATVQGAGEVGGETALAVAPASPPSPEACS